MATKAKLNPKDIQDEKYEQKAQLKAVEEKIYQTMEVSALLTQLTEAKVRVDQLKQDIAEKEKRMLEEKEIHITVSTRWEKELNAKIAEYEKLTEELEKTKKQYEDKIVMLMAQKDEEIANLKSDISNVRFEMNKKNQELQEELRNIREFKEKQDEYYSQLDFWKKKYDDLTHSHHDDLKRIDNQHSKAVQMLKDKYDKDINQIMHEAKKEAELEVERLEKKVIEENKKLHAELLEYKKEVEALKREKVNAIDENKQIKQNISLQEDGVIEYQAIHYRQESKIKKLKEKVQVLKNYIAQEVSKHTKEIEATRYQFQVRVGELEIQNQALKDELKVKIKENKNLKTLSQIILDQRSEIEEFLIETLDHVKEEVRRQKASEKRAATKLPEINSKSKLDTKPKKNWEKVDFTELDWEDKEKILRILFSKMNSGLLPANWRTSFLEKSSDLTGQSLNGGNHAQHNTN